MGPPKRLRKATVWGGVLRYARSVWAAIRIGVVGAWLLGNSAADASPLRATTSAEFTPVRPRQCVSPQRGGGIGLWDRLRGRNSDEFCALAASAYAQLAHDPSQAAELAAVMAHRWPGRPLAQRLLARSVIRAGDPDGGCRILERGGYLNAGVRLPPLETLLQARCAWRMGATPTAYEIYRRIDMAEARDGSRALLVASLLEGALVGMQLGGDALPVAVSDAVRAVEARVEPCGLAIDEGILALALSRQGRDEEARAVAGSSAGPWVLLRALEPYVSETSSASPASPASSEFPRGDREEQGAAVEVTSRLTLRFVAEPEGFPLMAPVSELVAVAACLAQAFDPDSARQLWRRYAALEGVGGALREHALRMIRELQGRHMR